MAIEALEFLEALAAPVAGDESLIFCGFAGDPNTAGTSAWRPRRWMPGDPLPINPARTNGYITQATFRRAQDGTWRRRTDLFSRGLAMMVDDVGTKVDPAVVERLAPSAIVETSPGNYQWWYFLEPPERSRQIFDGVIKGFINHNLLGNDPGMNGVNRVGRVPGYVNGKAAYAGFRVRLTSLVDRRYSLDEIREAFGIRKHTRQRRRQQIPRDAESRVAMYRAHRDLMASVGMLKRGTPNIGGWTEISCPWRHLHTNRADTGAAISEPNPENEWFGGFQCHHGHCIERTWDDLTQYLAEESAADLEMINELAVKGRESDDVDTKTS